MARHVSNNLTWDIKQQYVCNKLKYEKLREEFCCFRKFEAMENYCLSFQLRVLHVIP